MFIMEADIRHMQYLQRVSEGAVPLISPETASKAWELWLDIRHVAGRSMPVPAAATGPDGEMFYSWDNGRHHLEVELIPNKAIEFFYQDRESGSYWAEDYTAGSPMPATVTQAVQLFAQ